MHPDGTQQTAHSRFYELALGALIWFTFAAMAIGGLYACSRFMGD
jgi:hypothetical protein